MLDNADFIIWANRLNLSKETQDYISTIRSAEPSRRVKSGKGSMSGRFPSLKMGVTIQFESHKNELAYIYELEHNKEVIEFYDQPFSIPLKYQAINGRNLGFNHTPDFFVLKNDWAGWVECKTEERLLNLAIKQPNRFKLNKTGEWYCPPGESYASKFGLNYKVWSSKNISKVFQQNIEYLEDYFRGNIEKVGKNVQQIIFSKINEKLGLSLLELYDQLDQHCTKDDILTLIAKEEIFVNLYDIPLSEPNSVKIFLNKDAAQAYSNILRVDLPPYEKITQVNSVEVKIGKSIKWDGKIWQIANIGTTNITLIDEYSSSSDIPTQIFEELVRLGKITQSLIINKDNDEIKPTILNKLQKASRKNLAEANHRQLAVLANLRELPLPFIVSNRTLARWTCNYQKAKSIWGYGYLGLLPEPRVGNTADKLPEQSRKLLQTFISDSYETIKQKKKRIVFGEYEAECKTKNIEPASYKTFIKEVKKRPQYEQTLKRQGHRAAYSKQKFFWYLERDTPKHGEHPFHIVHIDYTEVDLEIVDTRTGKKMGKVWFGLAISASTRRVLAIYLSFDSPSQSSDMMLIREIVRRYGRMPQIIVVDGGNNFESIYFETLLATFECTKKTRPPAQPRFGSIIERFFGTANTQFFHNLLGNTQMMKLVRQVTKSVHPQNHAVWTLPKLWDFLCIYCYEIYDQIEHPALGQSPREEFELQKHLHGERSHRLITYDETFRFLTLPTTIKGTAKIIPNQGVQINYIYYWTDAFSHPEIEGTRVEIKFDPFNAGRAFAYINKQWVECYSENHSLLNGLSVNLLKLATEEVKQRKRLHAKNFSITSSDIAQFLQSAEATEKILKQQLADNEQNYILASINDKAISVFEIKTFLSELNTDPKSLHPDSLIKKSVENANSIKLEDFKTFEEVFNV